MADARMEPLAPGRNRMPPDGTKAHAGAQDVSWASGEGRARPLDPSADGESLDIAGREAMWAADRDVKPGALPSWRFWALVFGGMAMVGAAAMASL
ncbi:hypothetical protein ACLBXM_00105 [Xanthobacteraceae bacterium A53D]